MRTQKSEPSWWQLYVLMPGMIGLLVLGALAPLSERGHQAAAIGTLIVVWGLVELWLRANTVALLRVSEPIGVPQPRPRVEDRLQETERQPAPGPVRKPQEAAGPHAAEGALAFGDRDGTRC